MKSYAVSNRNPGPYQYVLSTNSFILNLHYLYIFSSRRSLMRTCRLARLVTMKAWKEDFMAVEIVEKKEGTDFEYMQKVQSELGLACEVKVLKVR